MPPRLPASVAPRGFCRILTRGLLLPAICIAGMTGSGARAVGQVAPEGGKGPAPAAPPTTAVSAAFPDDPRLDVALTMMRRNAFEAAALTARTVIAERPDVERAQAVLGIALNKLKQHAEARAPLERAAASTQAFPEQRHAAHFLGWCCFHLGDLPAARAAFEQHLEVVPNEPDSTFGLGLVAIGEDKLDDADALLAKALRGFTDPTPRPADQARVLTRMADVALRRDEVAKAEELLDRAIKCSPMQHETWAKVARVKDRLDKPAEADAARGNERRILEALGRVAPELPAKAEPPAAPADGIRFTDVTAQSGIACTPISGETPSTHILEVKGGGLALIDFDNDGDLDVFVPNGATTAQPERGPGARLFRNDGSMRFSDATAASGIAHTRWSFGAAVGDVDADGFDDIFICCFGPNVLLRNRGDGSFEDITARAGVGDARWATSAAFADLDGDGDLDLYVANYVEADPARPLPPASFKGQAVIAGPRGYPAAPDCLYENQGDGTFVDRSQSSGITAVKPGFGLNVAIVDFTGDGKPDILVGNDSQENNLFVPTGAWTYVDHGLRSGVAVNGAGSAQATMGMAVADVDGNGRPDVFTTNFSSDTNTLHLNLDGRNFDDRTNQFGLGAPSRTLVGWGTAFVDFDHDADEDLLVVNGHVYPQASRALMDSEYAQPPLLMERRGARFDALERAGSWTLAPRVDRTAVFADLDLDGDIDAVLAGLNQPLQVLRNDHDADHDAAADWVIVVPRDRRRGVGNHRAVGAEVSLEVGGAVQRRWCAGGGPFQSNLSPEVHFGVPTGTDPITVRVRFPDGTVRTLDNVRRGARVVVEHPSEP